MDIEKIKIELPIVVKEELDIDKSFEMKSENEEKPQIMKKEDFPCEEKKPFNSEENEHTFDKTNLHECCHCGKTETLKKMVNMPEQREEFLKWHRILGENIIQNADELKSSMVCRNHFDEKLDVSKLEFQHKHHVLKPKHKCCYCGKVANHKSMTRVSTNESILADWAAILGQCFFERVRRTKYALICRSHFDIEWNGLRPRKLLPIANLNENLDEEKPENHFVHQNSDQQFICAYCGEAKCYRQMTMFTQNSCKFIKWAENFDKAFSRRASKMKKAYFCRSHFDVEEENRSSEVSSSAEPAKIDDEKGFSKTYVYTCCQCGEKRELEAMIKTPQKREHFLRWHQMVGEQICGNVSKSSMVCRSHFNDEYGDSRLTDVIRKNGCIARKEPRLFFVR